MSSIVFYPWKVWKIIPIFQVFQTKFMNIQPLFKNPLEEAILNLNRNARAPKKANHGARQCSSVMRRLRKKGHYKKFKEKTPIEQEEYGATWDDI